MKLLIITSIAEDLHAESAIMEKASIKVFSVTETVGHKTEHHDFLPDNWFGKSTDGTNALFFFSFTEDTNATAALELVKDYNTKNQSGFPVKAFICPVEQAGF